MTIAGLAFHVHHDKLIEYCYDYDERLEAIKRTKPLEEQKLRLKLLQLIPDNRISKEVRIARVAYDKATASAWEAYKKAVRVENERT